MQDDKVKYDRSMVIRILRDLEVLVVSTDRIGSASYDMADEEYNAIFVRFFDEIGFFRKLSNARKVLSEPFSSEIGEDGLDELQREFQDLKFWPSVPVDKSER